MTTGIVKWFNDTKGFGFIDGDDGKSYFVHFRQIPKGISIKEKDKVTFDSGRGEKGPVAKNVRLTGQNAQLTSHGKTSNRQNIQVSSVNGGQFPYAFVQRKPGKEKPKAFHHRQEQDRLDVAFDVVWTTETPTALQPCEDTAVNESAVGQKGENTGYNKRWLMIGGRPAISPFTVKGAVANGVANLLGGCYRVPDREEGHNESNDPSTYPYTGAWKRYRVSMNAKSLPGIIQAIDPITGNVSVQPVIEYYLDDAAIPEWLKPGIFCQAAWAHPTKKNGQTDKNKRIVTLGTIEQHTPGTMPKQGKMALVYHGRYFFGMNLTLKPGEYRKRHHHRFYEIKNESAIDGSLPALSFAPLSELKKKVHTGNFAKNDRSLLTQNADPREQFLGKPWYENLRDLKPGDWCYYTSFADSDGKQRIAAIGKNFQFKALFNHGETLPLGNKTCTSVDNLCPRCALFGLAVKGDGGKSEAVGYAGRFKAATLVSDFSVTEERFDCSIPAKETHTPQKVELRVWKNNGIDVIRQIVLPIMGPPKPSKRDVNGYFDEKTGMIKGAKRYRHTKLDIDISLRDLVAGVDKEKLTPEGMSYAHQMRPVAAVCREGVSFSGTLGGENCSKQEIAAMLTLLDKRAGGHAFKLGQGKNIGLGSMSSRVTCIWLRKPGEGWQWVSVPSDENSRKELFAAIKEVLPEALEELKSIINTAGTNVKLHAITDEQPQLKFTKAGLSYWRDAKVETVGP